MIIETVASGFYGIALQIAMACVIVAILAAAYRLFVGPTLADRVIALDMVSVLLVVFLVLFKLVSGIGAYIYVAIGLALISFLATVAFARFIERDRGADLHE
ncbi:monovalent cation/H+ antiporter complex subunit F [Amaricoccus macauensis]|uniref:monovalent cation/H+ antiporter complex subunit F n=1 Tax=Amaricoccus macauensis TaxID=57001 RepID=UPI003C7B22F5